ncbi:hypothetical protein D9758_009396 [Tetrapyrgos nigripes]|uniref:F-box domain-containing protein n=1 Tax=Tetrapyrgos nigripes TaxID=182062 RepID=A0A8H5D1W2_9AGAR|nr:hypothetical protein D9758_009396 [Tetrapyrgos nigripes]
MTTPISLCDQCGHSFLPKFRCDSLLTEILDQLRSFYWPTKDDESQIYQDNDTDLLDTEINRFDTEISRLRDSLSALEEARDALVRVKAIRPALLSPIRKVPVEILELIFTLCSGFQELDHKQILSQHGREPKQVLSVTLPILNVAQTCSLWRNICLRRPNFWTNIKFRLDVLYDTNFYPGATRYRPDNLPELPLLSMVEYYLRLSKSLPLSIDFHAFGPDRSERYSLDFHRLSKEVLALLMREAGRWQSVALALDSGILTFHGHPLDNALRLLRSSQPGIVFPQLESFSIILSEEARLQNTLTGMDFVWELNRCAQVFRWEPDFASCVLTAPVQQLMVPSVIGLDCRSEILTTLTIHYFDYRSAHSLVHCHNLQRLRILSYQSNNEHLLFNQSMVCLYPNLSHLDITLTSSEENRNTVDLFKVLELPSLSSLVVEGCHNGAPWDYRNPTWDGHAFYLMMHRSDCDLETLSLSGVEMDPDEIRDALAWTPNLEHFTFRLIVTPDEYEGGGLICSILKGLCVPDALDSESNDSSSTEDWAIPENLVHLDVGCSTQDVDARTLGTACKVLESRLDDDGYYEVLEYFNLECSRLEGIDEDSENMRIDSLPLVSPRQTLTRYPRLLKGSWAFCHTL